MQITIKHLLEHKAGWGVDPASEAAEVARKKASRTPFPLIRRHGSRTIQKSYSHGNVSGICYDTKAEKPARRQKRVL